MKSEKRRIAFFAYAHNLAETTRGIEVAKALRDRDATVRFFSHGGPHEGRIAEAGFDYIRLEPRMTDQHHSRFMDLDQGRARGELYSADDWLAFATSESQALRDFGADAVYGGFNLPCSISARAARVPLVSLIPTQGIRAYYEHRLGVFPEFLENAVTKALPSSWKDRFFNFALTRVNYMPLKNINRAAGILGAAPLRSSFEIISGDLVLLADLPEITGLPASALPPNHAYIGPLFANLPLQVPPEVSAVFERPGLKVFCAMGSSGSDGILRTALRALKQSSHNVVAATTSILDPEEFAPFSDRFFVTRYLPALEVNALADIAVTHGGQGTLQNSCWAGRPVIGTPFQFEQQSNLEMLVRAGAAISIPLREFSEGRLLGEIDRMAGAPSYRQNAERLSERMRQTRGAADAAEAILKMVDRK